MCAQVFICVGILVAYLVGLPYRNNTPQHAYIGGSDVAWWRVMLALGLIPAALQVLSLAILSWQLQSLSGTCISDAMQAVMHPCSSCLWSAAACSSLV